MATAARIEVPVLGVYLLEAPAPPAVPAASPSAKGKKIEMEPESRAASSEPSSRKPDSKKKEKEPMPEEERRKKQRQRTRGAQWKVLTLRKSLPLHHWNLQLGWHCVQQAKRSPLLSTGVHLSPSAHRRHQEKAKVPTRNQGKNR